MPRKLTPGFVGTGSGWQTSNRDYQLTGVVGPGPYIGEGSNPVGASSGWYIHVQQDVGAHAAEAISRNLYPNILTSASVEGALDELAGTVPIRPPMNGEFQTGSLFFGIPQWGRLGLYDLDLITRGYVDSGNDPADVYPYYWTIPAPTLDEEFTAHGQDPVVDELWNTGATTDVPGAGPGATHAGGYTRSTGEVLRTVRVTTRSTTVDPLNPGFPQQEAVTITGTVFPADRGVLALFRFPPNTVLNPSMADYMTAFTAQPLLTRVVAAILLGQGIEGSACSQGTSPCVELCDGDPGGIFGLGVGEDGQYDPTAYPGQASGQYDLMEIHLGICTMDGTPLRPPWDDLDGDTVPGAQRGVAGNITAPGQVRLGTVPGSGAVVNYGIPILGGTLQAYTPAAQAAMATNSIEGWIPAVQQVGSTLFPTFFGIIDTNYFAYRLPLLRDYSPEGLRWTPKGQNPYDTKEVVRYFYPNFPNSGNYYYPEGYPYMLAIAGNYGVGTLAASSEWDPTTLPDLGKTGYQDYWPAQIARYRHTFALPVEAALNLPQDTGSYMLVHFKREADFEKFARDGVGWWDATAGYEIYGAHSLWEVVGVTQNLEHDGNVVNREVSTSAFAPAGPAPAYGYGSVPYHTLRSSVVMDPDGDTPPTWTNGDYTWTAAAAAGVNEGVMLVSGVAYFTPRLIDTNADNFVLTDMAVVSPATNWLSTYGVDSRSLTNGTLAPALISSPDPALLDISRLCGRYVTASTTPNALIPVGANPATDLTPDWDLVGLRHVNVPFTYCGGYTESAGPDPANPANTVAFGFVGKTCSFDGDRRDPVFSAPLSLRTFLRRPLLHVDETYVDPGLSLTAAPAATLLWHSSGFNRVSSLVNWTDTDERGYGNFVDPTGPPYPTYRALCNKHKDYEERFLDEIYRIATSKTFLQGGSIPAYDSAAAETAFHGPGLGGWVGGPIEVPVKIGITPTPWCNTSWTYLGMHLADLPLLEPELQVSGWPDRDPPLSAGAAGAQPMCGVLIHPQEDLSGVTPASGVHYTGAQPDYGVVGYQGNRYYIRALDLNFAHYLHTAVPAGTSKVRKLEGTSSFTLRLDGIRLENFAYAAPGPGRLGIVGLSVEVKVPGLTTWMDAGRPDGAGPSKQDALLDGAGCLVLGPDSYNFIDPVTKLVGCYVRINVGPVATLFRNTGTKGGTYTDWAGATGETSANECPVLVRVGLGTLGRKFNLQYTCTGNTFGLVPVNSLAPGNIRGLVGISVVHETVDTLLPPV